MEAEEGVGVREVVPAEAQGCFERFFRLVL